MERGFKVFSILILTIGLAAFYGCGGRDQPEELSAGPEIPCEQTSVGCDPSNDTGDTEDDGDTSEQDTFIDPPDSDNDGVDDPLDDFPNDSTETKDRDRDGVGDNADHYPDDMTESQDTDGDGIGDHSDQFPANGAEWVDTDGDGVGNNGDAFPNNPAETIDTDSDGVGDHGDACPTIQGETVDNDHDGVCNGLDAFPDDAAETLDSDGDGHGDNSDDLPQDATDWQDADGDQVGDRTDLYADDPNEWNDGDKDGLGDNQADPYPSDSDNDGESDTDGDGLEDYADLCPNHPDAWYLARVVKFIDNNPYRPESAHCDSGESYSMYTFNGHPTWKECREDAWPESPWRANLAEEMMALSNDDLPEFAELAEQGYRLGGNWESVDKIGGAGNADPYFTHCEEEFSYSEHDAVDPEGVTWGTYYNSSMTACLLMQKDRDEDGTGDGCELVGILKAGWADRASMRERIGAVVFSGMSLISSDPLSKAIPAQGLTVKIKR